MRVIGLISGTSFDAIDAAAVDLTLDGATVRCRLLGTAAVPYTEPLRRRIAAVLPPAGTTLEEVCQLDTLVGQAFADAAAEVDASLCEGRAELVCSHGQTVFHWVEGARALGTLQLGQPAWIAERTGRPVVSDVRAADIAAGGHGAPLVAILDSLLLGGGDGPPRAALNLGGIANITVLGAGEPIAYDTGPANALIDAAVARVTDGREHVDRDGERAARGRVDERLLARLLDDPYYALAPPKSTGKEHFHAAYLDQRLAGLDIAPDDLLATVTALTAETVARELGRFGVTEVIAAGGGTRNPTLMAELTRRLPGVRLRTTADLGIPPDAKEAVAFALIGFLTVHGLPAAVPSATGARRAALLGRITPGRGPLRLPEPAAVAPERLVIVDAPVALEAPG